MIIITVFIITRVLFFQWPRSCLTSVWSLKHEICIQSEKNTNKSAPIPPFLSVSSSSPRVLSLPAPPQDLPPLLSLLQWLQLFSRARRLGQLPEIKMTLMGRLYCWAKRRVEKLTAQSGLNSQVFSWWMPPAVTRSSFKWQEQIFNKTDKVKEHKNLSACFNVFFFYSHSFYCICLFWLSRTKLKKKKSLSLISDLVFQQKTHSFSFPFFLSSTTSNSTRLH